MSTKSEQEKINDLRTKIHQVTAQQESSIRTRINPSLKRLGVKTHAVSHTVIVTTPYTANHTLRVTANSNEQALSAARERIAENARFNSLEYGRLEAPQYGEPEITQGKFEETTEESDPQPENETYDDFVNRVYQEAKVLVPELCSEGVNRVLRNVGLNNLPEYSLRYVDVPVTATVRVQVSAFSDEDDSTIAARAKSRDYTGHYGTIDNASVRDDAEVTVVKR